MQEELRPVCADTEDAVALMPPMEWGEENTFASRITAGLGSRTARRLESSKRASVSVVIRQRSGVADILYIKRTENPADKWSGDVAFPGGRRDAGDPSDMHTAARECLEEVGLDLWAGARFLGQLDDRLAHAGRAGADPLVLSSFVFLLEPATWDCSPFRLQHKEVSAAWWVPVDRLLPPQPRDGPALRLSMEPVCMSRLSRSLRQGTWSRWALDAVGAGELLVPGISMQAREVIPHEGGGQAGGLLWGLTLDVTSDLLAVAGHRRLYPGQLGADWSFRSATLTAIAKAVYAPTRPSGGWGLGTLRGGGGARHAGSRLALIGLGAGLSLAAALAREGGSLKRLATGFL